MVKAGKIYVCRARNEEALFALKWLYPSNFRPDRYKEKLLLVPTSLVYVYCVANYKKGIAVTTINTTIYYLIYYHK